MNYQETLAWLDEVQARGIKLGLANMERLLDSMGDPQDFFPAIVVAGTNGKGSVCAMAASILRTAGYRVGLYTSPHLVRYEERMIVDGSPITPEEFAENLSVVKEQVGTLLASGELKSHPTHFEVLTAAAFRYFHSRNVQVGVLEVGMGGRLDAVATARTVVAVITNIDLEHTKYLGDTVEEIAAEKAGIIKEGCDVVTSETRPETLAVIRRAAAGRGVHLIERHREAQVTHSASAASGRFSLTTSKANYGELLVPLAGRHQVENATLAVLAVEAFCEASDTPAFQVTREAVIEGLARAQWPGRLQIVGQEPLILIDGAHNPAGCVALARALKDLGESGAYESLCLVFGVLQDKDLDPMLQSLLPLADSIVLTRGRSDRFRNPEEVAGAVRRLGGDPVVAARLPAALDEARRLAGAGDAICLCGSLYLVGDALELMGLRPYS